MLLFIEYLLEWGIEDSPWNFLNRRQSRVSTRTMLVIEIGRLESFILGNVRLGIARTVLYRIPLLKVFDKTMQ